MSEPSAILIVEDDEDLRELLRFNFERNSFDVTVCSDGGEALEFLRQADDLPDVIVLDLSMPKVDGLEFLRRRADTEQLVGIPTIILTGLDDEETLEEAYKLGADDYVTKPFSPNALITRVNHLHKQ